MPRFHFNVRDGVDHIDFKGTEFGNLAEARGEAVRFASQILHDHANEFWINADWRMEITDEVGLILFTLHFSAIDSPAVLEMMKPRNDGRVLAGD